MSQDKLGDTLDIHTGGVDNIFPHHENEIAQSEARTGKEFVKLWVHGEHLLVDGHKMAKSAGNFYKLIDLEEKGFSPLDFRYLCLQSHYRSKLNFTWEALQAAKNARARLSRIVEETRSSKLEARNKLEIQNSKYYKTFKEKMSVDLNTPEALAVVWEMMRDGKVSNEEKLSVYNEMDEVLGLYEDVIQNDIPEEIKKLAKEREEAREKKDYKRADELREQILIGGYKVEDRDDKYQISR